MKLKFEADLLRMLEEKDKIVNLTYAIVKLCGQEIQKRPEYADCVEIQNLKFSNTMISTFAKSHGIRKIYLKNKKIMQEQLRTLFCILKFSKIVTQDGQS